MAARGGRVALLAGAWVASALFAGWLLAPWFAGTPGLPAAPAPDPEAAPVDLPSPERTERSRGAHAAPTSTATDRSGEDPEPAVGATQSSGSDPDSQALPRKALATGTVVVTVRALTNEPVGDGWAYVLPAGAPGTDDNAGVLHASLENGRAELVVPAGQRLDIGVIGEFGAAMACDVRMGPDERTDLELAPPRGAPITVECASTLAVLGVECAGGSVTLKPTRPGLEFPGRAQPGELRWLRAPLDAGGRGRTPPAPFGVAYEVYPTLTLAGGPTQNAPPHYLAAEPAEVRAGGHMALRAEQHASFTLSIGLEGQPPEYGALWIWAVGWRRPLCLWDAAFPTPSIDGPARPGEPAARSSPTHELTARLFAGRYRVRWAGDHVEPGESDPIELVPGGQTAAKIVLRSTGTPQEAPFDVPVFRANVAVDPAEVAPARPEARVWSVAAAGLPESLADASIEVRYTLKRRGAARFGLDEIDRADPQFRMEAEPLAVIGPAVASVGLWWATGPLELNGDARLELAFAPAGLLCVVPGSVATWSVAPVTIERVDGAPLFWGRVPQPEGPGDVAALQFWPDIRDRTLQVPVEPGTILGPFPAGVMRFRVKRGGFVLGEVSAEVVAGQIRPLLLAR